MYVCYHSHHAAVLAQFLVSRKQLYAYVDRSGEWAVCQLITGQYCHFRIHASRASCSVFYFITELPF